MKLTDMKITKAERKERNKSMEVAMDDDDYGYGLEVHLSDHHLEKLGLDKLPVAGTKMNLQARVVVTGTHQSERRGDKHRSLDLQIQRLGLETGSAGSMEDAIAEGVDEANA